MYLHSKLEDSKDNINIGAMCLEQSLHVKENLY